MGIDRLRVREVLKTYQRAWETQDPELVLTIFTEDAVYHERVHEAPIRGHSGIREYWQEKVVESQGAIEFELLNLYLDGDTAIAEWRVHMDDRIQRVRKRMLEVAILEFDGDRIASLREYWAAETIGESSS